MALSSIHTSPRTLVLGILAAVVLTAAGPVQPGRAAAIVSVETPRPDEALSGIVRIAGWAADRDAPAGVGVTGVAIWLDGTADTGGTKLGDAVYGAARSDVARNLGSPRFTNSGFAFDWDTGALGVAATEPHRLWVVAMAGTDEIAWTTTDVAVTPALPTLTVGGYDAQGSQPPASPFVGAPPRNNVNAQPAVRTSSSSASSAAPTTGSAGSVSRANLNYRWVGTGNLEVTVTGLAPNQSVRIVLVSPSGTVGASTRATANASGTATAQITFPGGDGERWQIAVIAE